MRTTYMDTVESARENRKWYVIDATDLVLGRMAVAVATVLKGKHKPTYTPHIDGGDYVVIVNAEKVALTGNKMEGKKYYRHSQYAGGLKVRTANEMMEKQPQKIVEKAIRGMLPKGPEHEQGAQKPEAFPLEIK